MLTDKYILVLNATQTPYPIYENFINQTFWPQTDEYGNTKICQPSGPVISKTSFDLTLSELNQTLEIIPFTNWQGIPIKVTTVSSPDVDSSLFIKSENRVIINLGFGNLNILRQLNSSNLSTKGKLR